MCEGEISEIEMAEGLKDTKYAFAPGSDGLTTELCKVFWQRIKDMFLDSYKHSFETGHVSPTQKRGVIILIHKEKDLPQKT